MSTDANPIRSSPDSIPRPESKSPTYCMTPCSTGKMRYERAIPLLERALAAQPDMPVANMQYGMAQARLKHFDQAIAPLRKAVTLQPDNGMGHYELGLARFATGDWKAAAPEFEAAVARAPRWADAHF